MLRAARDVGGCDAAYANRRLDAGKEYPGRVRDRWRVRRRGRRRCACYVARGTSAAPTEELERIGARLGADVPVCLRNTRVADARGRREADIRRPLYRHAVCCWSIRECLWRQSRSSAPVPARFHPRLTYPTAGRRLRQWRSHWLGWANDLQAAAITLVPAIAGRLMRHRGDARLLVGADERVRRDMLRPVWHAGRSGRRRTAESLGLDGGGGEGGWPE